MMFNFGFYFFKIKFLSMSLFPFIKSIFDGLLNQ